MRASRKVSLKRPKNCFRGSGGMTLSSPYHCASSSRSQVKSLYLRSTSKPGRPSLPSTRTRKLVNERNPKTAPGTACSAISKRMPQASSLRLGTPSLSICGSINSLPTNSTCTAPSNPTIARLNRGFSELKVLLDEIWRLHCTTSFRLSSFWGRIATRTLSTISYQVPPQAPKFRTSEIVSSNTFSLIFVTKSTSALAAFIFFSRE
mmetsp:Transcript_1704/g.4011  ORF Transcript_1704/g.4011 Transcript_1704/m.4011 type:complete len:206 (+) Transcript_1704:2355-2972(+)